MIKICLKTISLANTILKLFTIMLSSRLDIFCDKYKIISDYQAAYKKGGGCEGHVFILNSVLKVNIQKPKEKVYDLFVDLSSAFDSIDHQKLWTKLRKIGLSTKFINTIKQIYSNAKAKIRTNEGFGEFFSIENQFYKEKH